MSHLYDKLMTRGLASLSDVELLALVLDDVPDSERIAESILLSADGSLAKVARMDISRLRMLEGIGLRRAQRLVLAAEWGRRGAVAEASNQLVVESSSDLLSLFDVRMRALSHEECWVVYLNSLNGIVEQQCVARGGVSAAVVDHRLIVKRALELLATRFVMVHNHLSGGSDPSAEDIDLTQKVRSAAALFDIELLDHLIISSDSNFSFLSAGLM